MLDDLPSNLGMILMLVTRDFEQRLADDLRSRGVTGIGKRHREVFLYLGRHGPSRSVDLAHAAGIRPQSMVAIIQELEELGLIERKPDPQDSRAKLVNYTPAGEAFIRELAISTRTVWDQYTELAGEKPLTRVIGGLQQLLAAAEGKGTT